MNHSRNVDTTFPVFENPLLLIDDILSVIDASLSVDMINSLADRSLEALP